MLIELGSWTFRLNNLISEQIRLLLYLLHIIPIHNGQWGFHSKIWILSLLLQQRHGKIILIDH